MGQKSALFMLLFPILIIIIGIAAAYFVPIFMK